jgi:hypothetical protein
MLKNVYEVKHMSKLVAIRWPGAVEIDWDRGRKPQGPRSAIKNGNNIFTDQGNNLSLIVTHAWHDDSDGTSGNSLIRCHQSGTDKRGRTIADWGGDFFAWDPLLWTDTLNPHDDPIRIIFNDPTKGPPVKGAGAQIQTQPGFPPNGKFTAKISAFGLKGEKIDEFTIKNCPSNSNGDGSAQFIGIECAGISRVEFYAGDLDNGEFYPEGFAINRLSVLI